MGRGKIEIKRIENTSNRQVTYSKRRTGIIKKAKEISVLCDAQVSLIIFGTSGKMHDYCSPSTTLPDLLDKYHKNCSQRLWDAKHENLSKEVDRIKKENDNMQIQLRHLKGEDITSMQHTELIDLEDTLENGLTRVRQKQSDYHKMRQIRIKETEEEHRELSYIYAMHKQEEELQKARQYDSQMPFAFRVQPMQPNLQERM